MTGASPEVVAIVRRGRAMAAWCRRVRERGGIAETEETEDLPMLRVAYLIALAGEQARRGRP